MKINEFEMVTALPDKIIKASECSDFHNYKLCKYKQKDNSFEFYIDKENNIIVSITKIINYKEASYLACQSYHNQISDILTSRFDAQENKSSESSSTFELKYFSYNYIVISKCINSTSNLVAIYLKDFYKEIVKMKSEEYNKNMEEAKKQALKDLNLE